MGYRKLTPGEISLAQLYFKNSIDYAKVRLYDSVVYPLGIQKKDRAMARANKISFPGASYSPDFSLEQDAVKRSVFIHEMVHVWQLQTGICTPVNDYIKFLLKNKFNDQACYFYKLDAAKDFTQYNFEQQAGMLQDYFLLSQHRHEASYKNRRLPQGETSIESMLPVYESILARFLADPGYGKAYKKALKKGKGPGTP